MGIDVEKEVFMRRQDRADCEVVDGRWFEACWQQGVKLIDPLARTLGPASQGLSEPSKLIERTYMKI